MRVVVGISDMKVSDVPGDVILTHGLGSCIAVVVHDPLVSVGGILHFQLPGLYKRDAARIIENPYMYANTGIPKLFRAVYELGAEKSRLMVKLVGGSSIMDPSNVFDIGKLNYLAAKELLRSEGVSISAEDVGGDSWRTVFLLVGSGEVYVKNTDGRYKL